MIIYSGSFFFSFAAKKLPSNVKGVKIKNQREKRTIIFFIPIAAFYFSITKVKSINVYINITEPGKSKDVTIATLIQFIPPKNL